MKIKDLEFEFVERTLKLLSDYDNFTQDIGTQFTHETTLLINCFLGLIILPKEKIISYIPNNRIAIIKPKCGLVQSTISNQYTTIRELIIGLRHSVAHIDFTISGSPYIETVTFNNDRGEVAKFYVDELRLFVEYYANTLLRNMKQYRKRNP